MKLLEGRYPMPGEPGVGLLGKIEAHFDRVIAGSRRLSTPEMVLVRAIVCGILEELGGKVVQGRYEVTLTPGSSVDAELALRELKILETRVRVLEEAPSLIGALKQQEAQLIALTQKLEKAGTPDPRIDALEKQWSELILTVQKPEKAGTPDPRIDALEKQYAELVKTVNGLRKKPASGGDKTEKW